MLILLLLSTLFCQATLTSVDAFTFSFPSFGPNSCIEGGDLICMGSATAGTGYISVTPDPQQGNSSGYNSPVNNVGRVLYRHPVIAWPSYISTTFTIRIIGSESLVGSGDGMAFVIAQDNRPSPPGSYGSNLGLLGSCHKYNLGEREYLAEISTIGRLRHKYILQLLGWCNEREHLLLVYEYMPNGSLDRFIGKVPLAWEIRYKILTGLASALLYLHEDCGSPMIHRDVKPNNVMLDSELKPRLGDFGLARLLQDEASVTTKLAGTPGYMAPEVGFIGKATPESDVYSFGMVVLEVVCGKRSKWYVEENSLVDYVWSLHGKGELLESVDEMLGGEFEAEQVKRALGVGLACLLPDATSRPKIRKVVQIFMNPSEPLMELPETRPDGVYLSLHSSSATTTTGFGSTAVPSLISTRTLDEKTTVQCNL